MKIGLVGLSKSGKTSLFNLLTGATVATFEVVDLAGISKGEREGLDAKEFRNADALLHVVRAFADATGAAPNPKGDIADLETELILADLEVVERRLERLEASIKKKRTDADARAIRGFTFLSQMPILHCLNLSAM